ncbi:MAG: domain containing protein [Flavipsychrobacter sp.]|jgi:gliding motility-associated-like protein|nr:domain containing protein [Flavipsychrobacter sp.]
MAVLLLIAPASFASHLIGGEMAYKYLGDSIVSFSPLVKWPKYEVTLILYQDCQTGQPEAILQDNPAYLGVYEAAVPYKFVRADSVFFSTSVSLPPTATSPCGTVSTNTCVLKKTFVKRYTLPPSSSGYIVCYQRCCRNNSISTIVQPSNNGATYYCTLPAAINNNSAAFKGFPPVEGGLNTTLYIDLSATDADGDSLSYELCNALTGAEEADIKPFPPGPPPFDNVTYSPSLSATNPIHSQDPIAFDPVKGKLICKLSTAGLYLIAECCHEWRNGVMINTIRREFQIKVSNSPVKNAYSPDAGPDVSIAVGDSVQFNATGADVYTWSPATYLSGTTIPNPVGHFPVAGRFIYNVHGENNNGCIGDDEIIVTVSSHSGYIVPTAFTPNGDGKNDRLVPYPLGRNTLKWFKVYNRRGNLVYTGGPGDPGWDGNYHDIVQDLGTFYWQLEYTDSEGKSHLTKGDVTLVR